MINQRVGLLGFVVLVTAVARANAAVVLDEQAHVALERDAKALVERIDEVGREIQFHAGRLQVLSGDVAVSRSAHYDHLEAIKLLVNRQLRPALNRLRSLQQRLPAWKQESIDRMMAAAVDLAADTTSAFFRKNERPQTPVLMNSEYQQLVQRLVSHAGTLVTTADAAHAYAAGRLKAADAGLPVGK